MHARMLQERMSGGVFQKGLQLLLSGRWSGRSEELHQNGRTDLRTAHLTFESVTLHTRGKRLASKLFLKIPERIYTEMLRRSICPFRIL